MELSQAQLELSMERIDSSSSLQDFCIDTIPCTCRRFLVLIILLCTETAGVGVETHGCGRDMEAALARHLCFNLVPFEADTLYDGVIGAKVTVAPRRLASFEIHPIENVRC